MFPRAAGAFAMAGLPVNVVGLTIEDQHAQPALKGGHAVLSVSGSLHNVRDHPIAAPPLRISILNNAGRVLAVNIADPGGASDSAGREPRLCCGRRRSAGRRQPTSRSPSPPTPPGARRTRSRGPPRRQSVGLRPAAPAPAGRRAGRAPPGPVQNAQPLPAGSKYALPESSDPVTG